MASKKCSAVIVSEGAFEPTGGGNRVRSWWENDGAVILNFYNAAGDHFGLHEGARANNKAPVIIEPKDAQFDQRKRKMGASVRLERRGEFAHFGSNTIANN